MRFTFSTGIFCGSIPTRRKFGIGHRLGISPDLAHLDMPILILYAISMYISMKLAPSPDPQMAQQQKSMSIMMTGMMIYWFMVTKWASAFLLYYLVQNIISTLQQYKYIYKPSKLNALNNPPDPLPTHKQVHAQSVTRRPRRYVCGNEKRTIPNACPAMAAEATASNSNRPRPKRKGGGREEETIYDKI